MRELVFRVRVPWDCTVSRLQPGLAELRCPETKVYVRLHFDTPSIPHEVDSEAFTGLEALAAEHELALTGHPWSWTVECYDHENPGRCIERIRAFAREARERYGIDMSRW